MGNRRGSWRDIRRVLVMALAQAKAGFGTRTRQSGTQRGGYHGCAEEESGEREEEIVVGGTAENKLPYYFALTLSFFSLSGYRPCVTARNV